MANPMNFGDPFLTYGPGLASLWGGEQVGLSFDQQRADKAKTLEDIYTSQQTRQHAAEMQPYKIDEAKLKNQKTKEDMSAAKMAEFTDLIYQDVVSQGNMQGPPDMVGNAARWGSAAKSMGLDPEDYRVRVILGSAAQGPQGLAKIRESLYRMSAKGLEKKDDAARQAAQDAAHGERTGAEIKGREQVARIQGQTQRDVAEINQEKAIEVARIREASQGAAKKLEADMVALVRQAEQLEAQAAGQTNPDSKMQYIQKAQEARQQAQLRQTLLIEQRQAAATNDVQRMAMIMQMMGMSMPGAGNVTGVQTPQPTSIVGAGQGRTPPPAAPPQQAPKTIQYEGKTLEVLGQNPDGSLKIRDPQTGRTGTIKQ